MQVKEIQNLILQKADDTEELETLLQEWRSGSLLEATSACVNLLNSKKQALRACAIWCLMILGPTGEDVTAALASVIDDKNEYVRSNAIVYLGEKRLRILVDELIEVLEDTRLHSQIRARAAAILALETSNHTLESLIRCLDDKDPAVVWSVIYWIGRRKDLSRMNPNTILC